ncbi:hypothetical protein RAS1_18530 [Phycisphaerae bacterium RAS1]|nr:hypothetical protein RAS1_18530 [Phycisphaerae bacterium RAS1]
MRATGRSLTTLLIVAAVSLALEIRAQAPQPDEWSPEVGELLTALRSGELERARTLSVELAEHAASARVRREAVALRAAALMLMPARTDRLDGRGLIAALADESPEIMSRPEVLLAGGTAAAALAETAAGLEQLDAAARGFLALGQADRRREALVALAAAWAQHTEWERTPPAFGVAVPADDAAKLNVRRTRIAAIADEFTALADAEGVARVQLVLAQLEIRQGDADAGRGMFERLAAAEPFTATAAQAALALAESHTAAERWADATPLYERVAAAPWPAAAEEARRRLAAMRAPSLELGVPRRLAPDARGALRLRTRNVAAVALEIRALDLGAWLESQQGRFLESKLPETGVLLASAEFDTRKAEPRVWWSCPQEQADGLTASLPRTAVLILARWKDERGEAQVTRRFCVCDGLPAGLAIGEQHAFVWTGDGQPATARFWMFGSFVPTRVALVDGAAVFKLPTEARLLRDRRWSCVVEREGRLALLTGELPVSNSGSGGPLQAAVLMAPVEPLSGDEVQAAGLFVSDAPYPPQVQVELRDAMENLIASGLAPVTPTGVFQSAIRLPDVAEGKTLRVVVHAGDALVESLMGPTMLRVASAVQSPIQLRVSAPLHVPPDTPSFAMNVKAWYPWGAPGAEAEVDFATRTLAFPDGSRGFATTERASEHLDLDARGEARLVLTPAALRATPPAGVEFALTVSDGPAFVSPRRAVTLIAQQRPKSWISVEPLQPRAGQAACVTLNCVRAAPVSTRPEPLTIRNPAGNVRRFPLFMDDRGWRTGAWIPTLSGPHTIVAESDGEPGRQERAEQVVQVLEADAVSGRRVAPADVWAACESAGSPARVSIGIDPAPAVPAVVLLVSATDVSGGVFLIPTRGERAAAVIDTDAAPVGLRVCVLALHDDELEPIGSAVVTAAGAGDGVLEFAPLPRSVAPGETVVAALRSDENLQGDPGAFVIARLVRLPDIHGLFNLGGQRRDVGVGTPSRVRAYTPTGVSGAAIGDVRFAPPVHDALAGAAHWLTVAPLGAPLELAVPAPTAPGRYELQAIVRTRGGAVRVARTPLRVESPIRATLDVPPRLFPGDRCAVALALENLNGAVLPARVRIKAADLLELAGWRIGDETPPVAADGWGEVNLPADRPLFLTAPAEALRPGDGFVIAEVEVGGRVETHRVAVGVMAIPPADIRGGIEVRRVFYRAVPESIPDAEADAAGIPVTERKTYRRELIDASSVLSTGDLLLIQEDVAIASPLGAGEWTQHLPGGFLVGNPKGRGTLRTIGSERRRPGGAVFYATPALPAGVHRHEYLLMALRPGVFSLPPPEVRSGGRRVPVITTPEDTRLRVDAR